VAYTAYPPIFFHYTTRPHPFMKPTPFTLPTLALLGALFLPAAGQTAGVLGRIGDLEVKIDEVRSSLAGLGEREGEAVAKDPSLLNQVVRSLLVQRLLLKEAEANGWDKRPEVIA